MEEWTREIRDLTPQVARMRELRKASEWERVTKLMPRERPYPLPPALCQRLGMAEMG